MKPSHAGKTHRGDVKDSRHLVAQHHTQELSLETVKEKKSQRTPCVTGFHGTRAVPVSGFPPTSLAARGMQLERRDKEGLCRYNRLPLPSPRPLSWNALREEMPNATTRRDETRQSIKFKGTPSTDKAPLQSPVTFVPVHHEPSDTQYRVRPTTKHYQDVSSRHVPSSMRRVELPQTTHSILDDPSRDRFPQHLRSRYCVPHSSSRQPYPENHGYHFIRSVPNTRDLSPAIGWNTGTKSTSTTTLSSLDGRSKDIRFKESVGFSTMSERHVMRSTTPYKTQHNGLERSHVNTGVASGAPGNPPRTANEHPDRAQVASLIGNLADLAKGLIDATKNKMINTFTSSQSAVYSDTQAERRRARSADCRYEVYSKYPCNGLPPREPGVLAPVVRYPVYTKGPWDNTTRCLTPFVMMKCPTTVNSRLLSPRLSLNLEQHPTPRGFNTLTHEKSTWGADFPAAAQTLLYATEPLKPCNANGSTSSYTLRHYPKDPQSPFTLSQKASVQHQPKSLIFPVRAYRNTHVGRSTSPTARRNTPTFPRSIPSNTLSSATKPDTLARRVPRNTHPHPKQRCVPLQPITRVSLPEDPRCSQQVPRAVSNACPRDAPRVNDLRETQSATRKRPVYHVPVDMKTKSPHNMAPSLPSVFMPPVCFSSQLTMHPFRRPCAVSRHVDKLEIPKETPLFEKASVSVAESFEVAEHNVGRITSYSLIQPTTAEKYHLTTHDSFNTSVSTHGSLTPSSVLLSRKEKIALFLDDVKSLLQQAQQLNISTICATLRTLYAQIEQTQEDMRDASAVSTEDTSLIIGSTTKGGDTPPYGRLSPCHASSVESSASPHIWTHADYIPPPNILYNSWLEVTPTATDGPARFNDPLGSSCLSQEMESQASSCGDHKSHRDVAYPQPSLVTNDQKLDTSHVSKDSPKRHFRSETTEAKLRHFITHQLPLEDVQVYTEKFEIVSVHTAQRDHNFRYSVIQKGSFGMSPSIYIKNTRRPMRDYPYFLKYQRALRHCLFWFHLLPQVCLGRYKGSTVAIKMPLKQESASPNEYTFERFLHEWNIMAKCNHEGIVHLLGGIRVSTTEIWLIMERVIGLDMHTVRYTDGPNLTLRQGVSLCYQLSCVLDYLHTPDPKTGKQIILHRDIKPENILLNIHDFTLRVCDFGDAEELSTGSVTRVSGATWLYAPPELLKSSLLRTTIGDSFPLCKDLPHFKEAGVLTTQWDIWSAGCVFQEILGGVNPFKHLVPTACSQAKTLQVLLVSLHSHRFQPEICDYLPQECQRIISACLQFDPKKRPTASTLMSRWKHVLTTFTNLSSA